MQDSNVVDLRENDLPDDESEARVPGTGRAVPCREGGLPCRAMDIAESRQAHDGDDGCNTAREYLPSIAP